jgi:2-iminobutanoate/2-iminopropanoate deaminase
VSDPWTWQERYGYTQAWRVDGATGLVFISGQGPIDPDGELVGAGDFEAQARATFLNLRSVLDAAGAARGAVVKLTAYLVDMAHVRTYGRVRDEFVAGPPAGTVVQVGALAVPGMMLEVEATAVVGALVGPPDRLPVTSTPAVYEVTDVQGV